MTKGGDKKSKGLDVELSFGGVSAAQKMMFAKHLAVMLKSGITISDGLKLLYGVSNGQLKRVIGEIYTSVRAGRSLASAMADYPEIFSGFFHGSVLAGEAGGNLEAKLNNIAAQLKKDRDLADKIKGALFYPVFVLVSAGVMGLFVSFYILPQILPLLSGLKIDLPWTTRCLIAVATFSQNYGLYSLIIMATVAVLLWWMIKQQWSRPFFHRCWLKLPLVGRLIRQINLSRFSLNLGMLLRSGLTITEALALTADSLTNHYYRQSLMAVKQAVIKGAKLSTKLSDYGDYFPDMAVKMIKIGEESGKLEETLIYLADFYETEVDNTAKNLSGAIEPILLVIIGLAVGLLAIAIITPIYSITGGVAR